MTERLHAPGFAGLGVEASLVEQLSLRRIVTPTPIQAVAIPDALAGSDVCGRAETGSGKTLAFGLPLVQRLKRSASGRPTGLVLVPTRELAAQVAAELRPLARTRQLRLEPVVGGVSLHRQAQLLRAGTDILVATPGRLNDLLARNAASVADVRLVVLDEADQMADLGFLPQVRRILDQIHGPRQVLLFSATLDGDVDRLIRTYQHNPTVHEVAPPHREVPTMKHRFIGVEPHEKVAVAASIAAGPEKTLMFVRTQRGADRLATQLNRQGVQAGVIHGGLSQPQRTRSLAAFSSGRVPVLVATNIAARGIHVDAVDTVIHHDPPEDSTTYLHRSGRTARAGAAGVVVTLVEQDQAEAVRLLKRQAALRESIVPMGPADPRLAALGDWHPPLDELDGGGRRAGTQGRIPARGQAPPRRTGWGGRPPAGGHATPGTSGFRNRPGAARDS